MKRVQRATEIPGPRSRTVVAAENEHLAPGLQAFAQWTGVAMERGKGSLLTDVDGNTYVDFIGGIGVASLGHSHPRWLAAILAQAQKLSLGSFTTSTRAALTHKVAALAPAGLDRLQLYSSGSEAVESALRLARAYTGRQEVVGFWGGFHGKTAGAVAVMGSPARHGLGPVPSASSLVPYADCYRCPFGTTYPGCGLACVEFAKKALNQSAGPVAAVIVEPMQGTAGNVIPPREFLPAVKEVAHDVGALLIADEMITGCGRTGRFWGSEHTGVAPDIVTLGKGLGGGYPVSGVLTSSRIAAAKPWANPSGASSSYGGNPLAAAAALATLEIIGDEALIENAAAVGESMLATLRSLQAHHACIGDVRGAGLFIGIELVADRKSKEPLAPERCRAIFDACVRRGLLGMTYHPRVRLQPALTIDRDTAAEGLAILDEVLGELG